MLAQQAVTGEVLVGWADPLSETPPKSDDIPQQTSQPPARRQKCRSFLAVPRCVTEGREVPCALLRAWVWGWGSGQPAPWMQAPH